MGGCGGAPGTGFGWVIIFCVDFGNFMERIERFFDGGESWVLRVGGVRKVSVKQIGGFFRSNGFG
jgi:hypothetical protein